MLTQLSNFHKFCHQKTNQTKQQQQDKRHEMTAETEPTAIEVDKELTQEEVNQQTIEKIESSFQLVVKTVSTFDQRYIFKTLRDLVSIRKQLNTDIIEYLITTYLNDTTLLPFVNSGKTKTAQNETVLPEIKMIIHLLLQFHLLDTNQLKQLDLLNTKIIIPLIKSFNRRSLDLINSKIWFYISRTKELLNDLISIRPELLLALRTSTIKHDDETSGSLITLILRNFILTKDYSQALNFIEKVEFPANISNSIEARYYYYLARINAIQLNYSDAQNFVTSAIRKSPTTSNSVGFLQASYKLNVLIELLTGDIPELEYFKKPGFEQILKPYQEITKAVKLGDLKIFNEYLTKNREQFLKDDNLTLVTRLRSNVIKTGIRIISLSYKKISLKDICIKLHLDNESSAEYIVSKAIADGVIDASINHQLGYMESSEISDIYCSILPQEQFNQRINFVNSLHNDSLKAMRFPSSDNDKSSAKHDKDELKEVEDEEMELINALHDESDGDFF